jgi:hypothetical protein
MSVNKKKPPGMGGFFIGMKLEQFIFQQLLIGLF